VGGPARTAQVLKRVTRRARALRRPVTAPRSTRPCLPPRARVQERPETATPSRKSSRLRKLAKASGPRTTSNRLARERSEDAGHAETAASSAGSARLDRCRRDPRAVSTPRSSSRAGGPASIRRQPGGPVRLSDGIGTPVAGRADARHPRGIPWPRTCTESSASASWTRCCRARVSSRSSDATRNRGVRSQRQSLNGSRRPRTVQRLLWLVLHDSAVGARC
jgi:hypothetical protein